MTTTRLFLCLPALVSSFGNQTFPWYLKLNWTNLVLFRSTRPPFWNLAHVFYLSPWSVLQARATLNFTLLFTSLLLPHSCWESYIAFSGGKMSGGGDNVFSAKIAEQAERYEGKGVVFMPSVAILFFLESSDRINLRVTLITLGAKIILSVRWQITNTLNEMLLFNFTINISRIQIPWNYRLDDVYTSQLDFCFNLLCYLATGKLSRR